MIFLMILFGWTSVFSQGMGVLHSALFPAPLEMRMEEPIPAKENSLPAIEKKDFVSSQEILNRLVAVSPKKGLDIRVYRIPGERMRAFTDGEHIYVSEGLAEFMGTDEDVVAAVLAHELAHIIAVHVPIEERLKKTQDWMKQVSPVTGELLEARRKAVRQDQEKEADVMGTSFVADAGYDPYKVLRFLKSYEMLKSLVRQDLLSGHEVIAHFDGRHYAARKTTILLTAHVKTGKLSLQDLFALDADIATTFQTLKNQ